MDTSVRRKRGAATAVTAASDRVVEPAKRDAIVLTATEVFSRGAKVSMDEIAKRAGVSKATLYLVSESKADLLYQCVHGELRRWSAHVGTRIDPRRAVVEILPAMSRAGIEFVRTHALVRQLFAGKLAGENPEWAQRFEELRAMGNTPVVELLTLGVRKQELRGDLDVAGAAAVIQDMIYAGFVVYGDDWGSEPGSVARWVETQAALCLRGLRVR